MDLFVYQQWYSDRSSRERTMICALSFVALYVLYWIVIQFPLNMVQSNYRNKISSQMQSQNDLQSKIMVIETMEKSDVYQKWLGKKKLISSIETEYMKKISSVGSKEFEAILRSILVIQPSINILRIRVSEPQKIDQNLMQLQNSNSMYERTISAQVHGTYSQIHTYLSELEKKLPFVHWRLLKYQSLQYPIGNIELEFSIAYEI